MATPQDDLLKKAADRLEEKEEEIRGLREQLAAARGPIAPPGEGLEVRPRVSIYSFPLGELERIERDSGINPALDPNEEFLRLNITTEELLARRTRTREQASRLAYGMRVVAAHRAAFLQDLAEQARNLEVEDMLKPRVREINALAAQGPRAQPAAAQGESEADRLRRRVVELEARIAGGAPAPTPQPTPAPEGEDEAEVDDETLADSDRLGGV